MVGLGGLEPPTSPLSGARSSHLSYRPNVKNNLEILSGGVLTAQRIPSSLMPELLHKTHVRRRSTFGRFFN